MVPMSSPGVDIRDVDRTRLRDLVSAIEPDITQLPRPLTEREDALFSSWAELVSLLALGPEPEMRECPFCKKLGIRAAALCGHCWQRLPPLCQRE